MSEAERSPYDSVLYPANALPQTHPERLATIATLFGMRPTSPSRCRMLDLGCGSGDNILAMAHQYPDSEFVGIDLSETAIAQGQAKVAAYGLKNMDLRVCDIMQIGESFGQFDYIVAYGVYSWVPDAVRERMLGLVRERLTPHGVALFSYNVYPGSRIREAGRSIMMHHTRAVTEPRTRIRQARAVLRAVTAASKPDTAWGMALREGLEGVNKKPDEVLYHDDLWRSETPFMFHEVAEAAQDHGLQYLCEASFTHSVFGSVPDFVAQITDGFPEEALIEREQYLDLLVGRWFRETLFCHADVPLTRRIDPNTVRGFSLAGDVEPAPGEADLLQAEPLEFTNAAGEVFAVEQPIAKAALFLIGRNWPRAISFAALADEAARLTGQSGANAEDTALLAGELWRMCRAGHIQLHVAPPAIASEWSERPRASAFARRQAEEGMVVTNLRHVSIGLDGVLHPLVVLLDGTRSLDDLVQALASVVATQPRSEDGTPQAVSREWVSLALDELARNALLTE